MTRNPRIELFRMVCMFGVCLLHALEQGGYADSHRGLDNLMTPSVVGFVFITGWFGVKFRLKSVLRLLGVCAYCGLVVACLDHMSLANWWEYATYGWFPRTYLALMAVAPLLEPLFVNVESERGRRNLVQTVLPVLFVVFGWSYVATTVPVAKTIVPSVGGFGAFGLLTFVGIYVFARTCRLVLADPKTVSTRMLMFIAMISGVACWAGFRHYNSPFALAFAASLFLLTVRMPFPSPDSLLSRLVLLLSPSMFAVYLIHANPFVMKVMRSVQDDLIGTRGWSYYLVCFACAFVFFVGGMILDVPRRLVVVCIRKGGSGS